MSNYSYNDKLILIIATSVTLICLILTVYFVSNRILIKKVVKFQKVFVLDTTGSLKNNHNVKYEKFVYNPPLVSANTNPAQWNNVAKDINELYKKYEKIIVIMGSDTLPYPAAAIAFMLEKIDKPIIFTSPKYLVGALEIMTTIPEVMVFNGKKLLRATRTITTAPDKFISPNFPALTKKNSFPKPTEPYKLYLLNPAINIAVIRVHPNISVEYLNKILDTKISAVILELWGVAKIPLSKEILQVLFNMIKKGIIVVSVLQYNKIDKYKPNEVLKKIGVISLGNMTTPAAYAKLSFILHNVKEEMKVICNLLEQNFRGEL